MGNLIRLIFILLLAESVRINCSEEKHNFGEERNPLEITFLKESLELPDNLDDELLQEICGTLRKYEQQVVDLEKEAIDCSKSNSLLKCPMIQEILEKSKESFNRELDQLKKKMLDAGGIKPKIYFRPIVDAIRSFFNQTASIFNEYSVHFKLDVGVNRRTSTINPVDLSTKTTTTTEPSTTIFSEMTTVNMTTTDKTTTTTLDSMPEEEPSENSMPER